MAKKEAEQEGRDLFRREHTFYNQERPDLLKDPFDVVEGWLRSRKFLAKDSLDGVVQGIREIREEAGISDEGV